MIEVLEPGATVSAVADRNGISRSQLYAWKRLAQRGGIPGISLNGLPSPLFAPVRIEAAPPLPLPTPAMAAPAAHPQRRPDAIEIASQTDARCALTSGLSLSDLLASLRRSMGRGHDPGSRGRACVAGDRSLRHAQGLRIFVCAGAGNAQA